MKNEVKDQREGSAKALQIVDNDKLEIKIMTEQIEKIEGSVKALQSTNEALKGFQPHYDAWRQAEANYLAVVDKYVGQHNADPTEEMDKVRKSKIDTYWEAVGIPTQEVSPLIFNFIYETKTSFEGNVPEPEKKSGKGSRGPLSTVLTDWQKEHVLPLLLEVVNGEWMSNSEIQKGMLAKLDASNTNAAGHAMFPKYKGAKKLDQMLDKYGLFTTVTRKSAGDAYRYLDYENRDAKGDKGYGTQPYYRLKTDRPEVEAPTVEEELLVEALEDQNWNSNDNEESIL